MTTANTEGLSARLRAADVSLASEAADALDDLLSALKGTLGALHSHDPEWPYIKAARAAIAKAEGRS